MRQKSWKTEGQGKQDPQVHRSCNFISHKALDGHFPNTHCPGASLRIVTVGAALSSVLSCLHGQ